MSSYRNKTLSDFGVVEDVPGVSLPKTNLDPSLETHLSHCPRPKMMKSKKFSGEEEEVEK